MDLDEENRAARIVSDVYEEHGEAGTVSFTSLPKALSEVSALVAEFSDDHGHEDIGLPSVGSNTLIPSQLFPVSCIPALTVFFKVLHVYFKLPIL